MESVLLTTTYTGFNYGTSLQALAGKYIISKLGYSCDFVRPKSLVKGRDIRVGKLVQILCRAIWLGQIKGLLPFIDSYKKNFVEGTESKFFEYNQLFLEPEELNWHEMKEAAKKAVACVAGSDQIWISVALYIDPIYYLRFAPSYKRIAFAPSFGRDFIAEYNKRKIGKWVSEIPYLSIRERSGVTLIKNLTGRSCIQLIDPTLGVSRDEWIDLLSLKEGKKDYILTYFLDAPSEYAKKKIAELKEALKCEVVNIPFVFEDMSFCDRVACAGPKEFLELILNAKLVCTDSFHGSAFSVNFRTPFFVFERMYGSASKQSARILSLLQKFHLESRYENEISLSHWDKIDFESADTVLTQERFKIFEFLKNSINDIKMHRN